MRKIKEKIFKKYKLFLGLSFVLAVFVLAGAIFFFSKIEKFEIPASLKIPLFEKTKIVNVSQNAPQGMQEIIFLSKASIVELFKFYEGFAKKNGFVFVNTGLSERKVSKDIKDAPSSFTLTPMIGRTDLLTYFFSLKSQGGQIEVTISYWRSQKGFDRREEEKIKLPKDFKLKF